MSARNRLVLRHSKCTLYINAELHCTPLIGHNTDRQTDRNHKTIQVCYILLKTLPVITSNRN